MISNEIGLNEKTEEFSKKIKQFNKEKEDREKLVEELMKKDWSK